MMLCILGMCCTTQITFELGFNETILSSLCVMVPVRRCSMLVSLPTVSRVLAVFMDKTRRSGVAPVTGREGMNRAGR